MSKTLKTSSLKNRVSTFLVLTNIRRKLSNLICEMSSRERGGGGKGTYSVILHYWANVIMSKVDRTKK